MEIGWEWKQTGWYVEPENARDVMTMVAAIGAYSANQRFAWRGMASVDYDLSSSLLRRMGRHVSEEELRTAEIDTLSRARAWGLGVQATGHVDDLALLADLQHFGVATRLIDFSSNPMTALWFACQPTPNGARTAKSGVLVALNTTGWPEHQTVPEPTGQTWSLVRDPTGARLQNALNSGSAFRVESVVPNVRLRAQEGFFITGATPEPPRPQVIGGIEVTFETVTPFRGLPIQYYPGNQDQLQEALLGPRLQGAPRNVPFVAVGVRSRLKAQLLKVLSGTYNRRASVLFPDIAGFRQFGDNA